MEVFDLTVKALVKAGLMVILNNHSTDAWLESEGFDHEGLLGVYYSPVEFELAWVSLTAQYKDEPMVIGNDLRNDVHDWISTDPFWGSPVVEEVEWGSGDESKDWKLAAERIGNILLKIDPNLLIIVSCLQNPYKMS